MVAFKISYKDVVSLLKIDQNTTIEVLDNLLHEAEHKLRKNRARKRLR